MNVLPALPVDAFVTTGEQPMMIAAGEQLSEALRDDAERPWPVRLSFSSFDTEGAAPGPIVVTSLLADAMSLEPLATVEAVWRDRLAKGLAGADRIVVLCTVFRVVGDRQARPILIERIRRLNLLAAELSQAFNTYVVDLDRTLSFFGAATLQSDFRLVGHRAAEAAGHAVVTTLFAAGLGGLVPVERQAIGAKRHGGLHQLAAVVEPRLRARERTG